MFQRASEAGGFTGISVAAFFLFFSALVVALSFLIIALQVFITLLEFKLVTLGGFILIPFALLDRTESLAQAALGYVIAAGIKIFTLAVVVSFAFAIFPNIPIPDELSFTTQFVIMGTALTFVLLALKAPSLASSMISGGPSLGVGALAQTAAAVGCRRSCGLCRHQSVRRCRQCGRQRDRPSQTRAAEPIRRWRRRTDHGLVKSFWWWRRWIRWWRGHRSCRSGKYSGPITRHRRWYRFRRRIIKRFLTIRWWRRWKAITRFWWRAIVWWMVVAR